MTSRPTENIQRLAPPGTKIGRGRAHDSRWKGRLPTCPCPNAKDATFGDHPGQRSEPEAVLVVLRALWAVHEREGLRDCPWDLDAGIE